MRNLKVEDLMLPLERYTRVAADATLKDAILALEGALHGVGKTDPAEARDFAVLVLDENGQVIGRLVVWDLLRALRPPPADPLAMIESFWTLHRPPGQLAGLANDVKVGDLVEALGDDQYIAPDADLDTALDRLTEHRLLSLIVVDGGRSVGVLRVVDVFQTVCDTLRNG